MHKYIARQPIFTREREIHGYELLYRNSQANFFDGHDVDEAARQMIRDSAVLFGIDALTDGKKAFVNLTRESLIKGYARLLPPELAVLEILESVEVDAEVLHACRELKSSGYTLALDDFVYRDSLNPLIDLADIVKVDFLESIGRERRDLFTRLTARGKTCLAEKLETKADYEEAREIGYQLFQGFYLTKPMVLTIDEAPSGRRNLLQFLQEIHEPELNHAALGKHIGRDLNLAYKLLRHWQLSPNWQGEIQAIDQVLAEMSDAEIRHWAMLTSLRILAEAEAPALVRRAALRGKMCQLLAVQAGHTAASTRFFQVGMFSLVDTLIDRDQGANMQDLPLDSKIKTALLRQDQSAYRQTYEIVLACEQADPLAIAEWGARLNLDLPVIDRCFWESKVWADTIHG